MTRRIFFSILRGGAVGLLAAQPLLAIDKYDGPRPRKKDVLYVVHADNLTGDGGGNGKPNLRISDVNHLFGPGAASASSHTTGRAHLLMAPDENHPGQLGVCIDSMSGTAGERFCITGKKRRLSLKQFSRHLSLRSLEHGLTRIEASEPLDPGEYSISPEGSNTAFCFSVY